MTPISQLEEAIAKNPADARVPFDLGCLLYDQGRREEAITWWEKSAKLEGTFPAVWRRLGIAYYNVFHDRAAAEGSYKRAFRLTLTPPTEEQELDGTYTPTGGDADILYERDQLARLNGRTPQDRQKELETYLYLVQPHDDLTLEFCTLLNLTNQHDRTLEILQCRTFQPKYSAPGLPLELWTRAHLALGRNALWRADGSPQAALAHFQAALNPPLANLAGQPLSNPAELHYWSGVAANAPAQARQHFQSAAAVASASSPMYPAAPRTFSPDTFFAGMALRELDRPAEARDLFDALLAHAQTLKNASAPVAPTSPPPLFDHGPQDLHHHATLLEALALYGLDANRGADRRTARRLLGDILIHDPNHMLAADLLIALDWN